MTVRFPAPLRPGDRIGLTAPSTGVPAPLQQRFEHCVRWLKERGYDVVVGECLDGSGVVSASPQARAAELTAMLTDPSIRAVVPPWGGELAIEILPHLDWDAIGAAEPTWLVGYSDLSTVLLPLTTRCGVATLHGQCLMETPYELPGEVAHWTSALSAGTGSALEQRASTHHRSAAAGHDHWETNPEASAYTLDEAGAWRLLDGDRADVTGTLIGGCAEVLGPLAGTPYGDVRAFAEQHAPDGLIVYVEACEDAALNIARHLWSMRLAGWFEHANAILIGRTHAPASGGFTQDDAVRSALGDLGIPVVLDVDCGHVPPQLALVNGATARVVVDGGTQRITQTLGPA
jgi:muramoyltetrapeptide carboxypeptidase